MLLYYCNIWWTIKKDAISPRFDVSPNYYTPYIISNRVNTSCHNMVSVKLGLGPFFEERRLLHDRRTKNCI